MKIHKAVYAGSFDPFTNADLNIIEKSFQIFDNITILLVSNPDAMILPKDRLRIWDQHDMIKAIKNCLKRLYPEKNWFVDCTDGLVSDYCKNHGASYLISGLRKDMRVVYEEEPFKLSGSEDEVEEIYFRIDDAVSAALVRSCVIDDQPFDDYVPQEVCKLAIINSDCDDECR